ncbi:hypothetical protein HanIR_Chr05g0252191 [Helianthus annuus]|nr:hypothetical protein HanIR_Chr05g0252191 [Helianthus annuus]
MEISNGPGLAGVSGAQQIIQGFLNSKNPTLTKWAWPTIILYASMIFQTNCEPKKLFQSEPKKISICNLMIIYVLRRPKTV